jgi:alanine racemase
MSGVEEARGLGAAPAPGELNGTRAAAYVDLEAVRHNCERLLAELNGGQLCAVVKADGYGHGGSECARAALRGGASWLAVATLGEARTLREDGIQAPILIMAAMCEREEIERAIELRADIVIWSERSVALAAEAAARTSKEVAVHVKLDTGMGRYGTRDPVEGSRVAAAASSAAGVRLAGVMTHFATADIPADGGFFERQLAMFTAWVEEVASEYPGTLVHAANSAAVLREPRAHFDMARCGIAVYGLDPFNEDPFAHGLRPALELRARIADVKLCHIGESTGYGRRFLADRDTHLGMLPIGYGDGWRRALSGDADVLVAGARLPLVGTVSMDNVAVDLGPDPAALELSGADAILIGRSGAERITVEELARRLDTINYEITCGLSARVPRVHGPAPAVT